MVVSHSFPEGPGADVLRALSDATCPLPCCGISFAEADRRGDVISTEPPTCTGTSES